MFLVFEHQRVSHFQGLDETLRQFEVIAHPGVFIDQVVRFAIFVIFAAELDVFTPRGSDAVHQYIKAVFLDAFPAKDCDDIHDVLPIALIRKSYRISQRPDIASLSDLVQEVF